MSCWQVAGGKTIKGYRMVAICAWVEYCFCGNSFQDTITIPDLDKVKEYT